MRSIHTCCCVIALSCAVPGRAEVAVRELDEETVLLDADVRAALGDSRLSDYCRALWPSRERLVGDPLDLRALDPGIIKEAETAIRHVLKDGIIPEDLAKRFIAQRVRLIPGKPWILDALLARYELGDWRVEIQEGNLQIGVLCCPVKPRRKLPPEEYALGVAREVLRIPPKLRDQVYATYAWAPEPAPPERRLKSIAVGASKNIFYGVLRCKAREPFLNSLAPDRPKDTWVGQIGTMTDGHSVYFTIRETHREPGRPQARPGPIRRFPPLTASTSSH